MVLKDENGNNHHDKVNYKHSSFNLPVVLVNGEETDEPQLETRSRF